MNAIAPRNRNEVGNPQNAPISINSMVKDIKVRNRFAEVLGEAAPGFLDGLIAASNANPKLAQCNPNSVLASAMVAAVLDLSVVPGLGQAAPVPFNTRRRNPETGEWETVSLCQLQIMTRGWVQLAQRTGLYRTINSGKIYSDEYDGEDIMSGEVMFHRVKGGFRDQGKDDEIIGYFAFFETVTGFRKVEFWTRADIWNHATRFSKSWMQDKKTGEWGFSKGTPWADHFDAMAEKTVLKSLLTHYGPLSVKSKMAEAFEKDQQTFDQDGNGGFSDNPINDAPEGQEYAPDEPIADDVQGRPLPQPEEEEI